MRMLHSARLGPGPLTLALLVALLAGCYPEPATREGRTISDFYGFVLILALIVVAIVWALLTFAILRYRRGARGTPGDGQIPPQVGGHIGLEALWTGLPLLTIVVLFVMTLFVLDDVDRGEGGQPVELSVEAFRWGWRIDYPAEGVILEGVLDPGPEAVVPVGRPLRVTLTSADVVHSFYVPQFLYKRDAVPGQTNVFEVIVEREGLYQGQCAEYCGLFHARMPFSVRAVPEADYQAWLAERRAEP